MIVTLVGVGFGLGFTVAFAVSMVRAGRCGAVDRRSLIDGGCVALVGVFVSWLWVPWDVVPPLAWALPVALTAYGVLRAADLWPRLPWVTGPRRGPQGGRYRRQRGSGGCDLRRGARVSEPDASRLDDLERRVRILEQALAERPAPKPAATPAGQEPAAVGGDAFWALEGLRGRVPPDPGAVLFTGVVTAPGADRPYLWQETFTADDLLTSGWAEAGTALGALASPVRMQLLREILHGRNTAAALAEVEGFGTSGQIYHHLRQLTAAGWLRTSSRGRFDVPPERIVPLLVAVAAARR